MPEKIGDRASAGIGSSPRSGCDKCGGFALTSSRGGRDDLPYAMRQRPGDLRAERAGAVRVVVLRGEHDVSTIRRLESALEGAEPGEGTVVDLTECGFIDSSSLAVLFHASQVRPASGFAIAVPPDTEVARMLDLVAFGKVVPVYPTREDAVRAINAEG